MIPSNEEASARSAGHSLRRFLGGGALIALLTTAVVATAAFEGVSSIADEIAKGQLIQSGFLAPETAGQPATILLIGSDKRYQSKITVDRESPPHTDTIILIRLDPNLGRVSVMSVPRDLLVPSFSFKGVQYTDEKINFAYTVGNTYGSKPTDGDTLALQVVEHALGGLKINDIIDLNFESFVDVIAKLGCVYVDVDHWFYNPGNDGYSAIDVKPGYQCLAGDTALNYVRYRHTDSTFARDARQQDFLRQAKQQLGVTGLLSHYQDFLNSIGPAISTNIRGSTAVLHLVELALASLSGPVRTVPFPDQPISIGGGAYQTASPADIRNVVADFLSTSKSASDLPPPPATPGGGGTRSGSRHGHHATSTPSAAVAGLSATPAATETQAFSLSTSVPFKVYVPALTYDWTSQFDQLDYRAYKLKDLQGGEHWAYYITWNDTLSQLGSYYGIEGMNWTDPPLFANADEKEYDGREYLAVGNGTHIQDLGWIVGKDLYWINNTIFDGLSDAQMYALAASSQPVSTAS
jgi:LCP family protein required for cell wall assembly